MSRIKQNFYIQDVLDVAQGLLGCYLVIHKNRDTKRYRVIETEAYRGEEDKACHASKGCTPRTRIMFAPGGHVYVYLIYGMYWMLNVVTGQENNPQAVLIRGVEEADGPGKLGKLIGLDKSFYGEDLTTSTRIWFEHADENTKSLVDEEYCIQTTPRIGIEYAGEPWVSKHWRFLLIKKQ